MWLNTFKNHTIEVLCLETLLHLNDEWVFELCANLHLVYNWTLIEGSLVLLFHDEFHDVELAIFFTPGQIYFTKSSYG